MELDVGPIIAGIDLGVGIFVVILSAISLRRLQGGVLAWVAGALLATAVLYVGHAGVETFGFGEELYAETALIATLLLGFSLAVVDLTLRKLG